MLVSAERFRILENGYRASEALYESEEDLTKLASQLVVRDFAVNPLLYPVNPSCEILLKTKDPSSGSILEADCALRKKLLRFLFFFSLSLSAAEHKHKDSCGQRKDRNKL